MGTSDNNSDNKVIFQNADFPTHIFTNLNLLRHHELFCDVKVLVPGKNFNLHKTILVANSQYFRDIFTLDANIQQIKLNGMKSAAFSSLVDYMYSGEMHVEIAQLTNVCEGAELLQLSEISKWCVEVMIENVSIETCIDFVKFASKHDKSRLKDQAMECLIANFSIIAKSSKFYRLKPDLLATLLSSDNLKCKSEVEVFTTFRVWLDHNPKYIKEETKMVEQVLANIRFGLIPLKVNKKIIKDDTVMLNTEKARFVIKAIDFQQEDKRRPLLAGTFCKPRSHNSMLHFGIPVGPEDCHESKLEIDTMNIVDMEDESLIEMDMPLFLSNRYSSSFVTVNNFLFLCGGCIRSDSTSGSSEVTNETYRYDPLCDRWTELTPMLVERSGATAFVFGGNIYLVGGFDKDGNVLESGEMYDMATDMWQPCANLPEGQGHIDAATCVLNGQVYISGGTDKDTNTLDSILMWDGSSEDWTVVANLNVVRSAHTMCTDGQKLYVIGGVNDSGLLDTVEMFDPETNQVTSLSSMPHSKCRITAVCHEQEIFIAGGTSNKNTKTQKLQKKTILKRNSVSSNENDFSVQQNQCNEKRCQSEATDDIFVYNITTDTWRESELKLTHPTYHGCAVNLVLPHRR